MKIKISIILMFLSVGSIFNAVYAQEQLSVRQKAEKLYAEYNYHNATALYLKLAESKKAKTKDLEQLANCYLLTNNYTEAEKWLAQAVVKTDISAEALKQYADVLKTNEKYQEAKTAYQNYAKVAGNSTALDIAVKGCDSALLWKANPTAHIVTNEENINTNLSEFAAAPIAGKIYFTAEPSNNFLQKTYGRTGNSFLKVFSANVTEKGILNDALIINEGFNNEMYHVGPVISNKTGDKLFVTRTYVGKKPELSVDNKRKFKTNNLELFIYTFKDGKWAEESFAYNKVDKYSVGHAALSADEKILYFVSDMPGSVGGTDIWYSSLLNDGSWGQPLNAGKNINSTENEMFPTIAQDGTLYFSSNGFLGMGGLDVFFSKGALANWSNPINMHYPINSGADDFAYLTTAVSDEIVKGYLSSNRANGKGGDDIYSFVYNNPKIILALKGVSYNAINKSILKEVEVVLYNADKSIAAKSKTPENGTYFFELEKNKDYYLVGNKTKFNNDTALVSTKNIKKSDTLEVNLNLQPKFYVGQIIKLKDIHYDFDKDNIRADAAKILDEVVQTMKEHPTLEIELGSHTDSRGSDAYNLNLSQRRAKSAVAYIIGKGIARTRIVAKGYGETQLTNQCGNGVDCSDEDHQANRRTEIRILKF